MSQRDDTYERGARLTLRLIQDWLREDIDEPPLFQFPPKEVALLADLRDIGQKLAVNDSAHRLVDHLIKRVVERTGQAPTTMMLRIALEVAGLRWQDCTLDELGLSGVLPAGRQ